MNPNPGAANAEAARGPSGAEVARRVLKTLADRRLIPTPESFTQVYFEVTGQRAARTTVAERLRRGRGDLQWALAAGAANYSTRPCLIA